MPVPIAAPVPVMAPPPKAWGNGWPAPTRRAASRPPAIAPEAAGPAQAPAPAPATLGAEAFGAVDGVADGAAVPVAGAAVGGTGADDGILGWGGELGAGVVGVPGRMGDDCGCFRSRGLEVGLAGVIHEGAAVDGAGWRLAGDEGE
jgi:hypothetical protein